MKQLVSVTTATNVTTASVQGVTHGREKSEENIDPRKSCTFSREEGEEEGTDSCLYGPYGSHKRVDRKRAMAQGFPA